MYIAVVGLAPALVIRLIDKLSKVLSKVLSM
jgi:hypothetical protein